MQGKTILVILLIIGIIAKSNLIAMAACILLILKFARLQHFFPLIERRGMEAGLLFLLLAILVPVAAEDTCYSSVFLSLFTVSGAAAAASGIMATVLNSKGIDLLQNDPELIIGLLIGSIGGIALFGGVPVGPLMAAGLTSLFLWLVRLIKRKS